jgi:putative oxidoreductase
MNDIRDNRSSAATVDIGLLVIRVIVGLTFFMHGWQKLVDNGLNATEQGFDAMGAPLPAITSVIVTFVELIGGAALILGALTRIVTLLLLVDMLVAMFVVHIDNGFFAMNNGFELVFLLGGVALGLFLTGPGRYSVDEAMGLPFATSFDAPGNITARR